MKTKKSESKNTQFTRFLSVQVVRSKGKNTANANQCEVVAIAPGKDEKIVLKKGFEDYTSLADGLKEYGELSTKSGATCVVRFAGVRGATHTLFIGLGKDKGGYDTLGAAERVRRFGAVVVKCMAANKIKSADIHLDSFLVAASGTSLDSETAAYAFVEGAALGAYKFDKYLAKKDDKKKDEAPSITLIAHDAQAGSRYEKGIAKAKAYVVGTQISRDLSNEPSNHLNPVMYADLAAKLGKESGLKVKVLDEKEMKKEGMGMICAVGQGSEHPPRMVVLEYNPSKKAKKSIAFVGKGVTFDSGGISIKPSAKMEEMKHDMSGSATVLGAIITCAALKVPVRIVAALGLAENMPDGNAICPGNIVTARNGKTVEITNTDAEGRLVLGDVVDYVQDMKVDYMIDLATLTGACGVALGKACAGLMANNDGFVKQIKSAATATGERVWELPMYEEYFDDLKSEYADMRNSGDAPLNGTTKGAKFIEQFVRPTQKWAHLDIAYTANSCSHIPYNTGRGATGYGVRLLTELAIKLK